MRFLVGMGLFEEAGQSVFKSTPLSGNYISKSPLDTVLVDIGGGVGHDLIAFKQQYPSLPGKRILQEIPVVIESIKGLPAGIDATKHDFFAEQPVKGAKAYYLAHVLHDWPDKQSHVVLSNIREAMNSDSILLINDNVLPCTLHRPT